MATQLLMNRRSLAKAGRELGHGSRSDRAVAAARWKPDLERYWRVLERRSNGIKTEWAQRWESWFSKPPSSDEPVTWTAHTKKTRLYNLVGWLGLIAEALLAFVAAQQWAIGSWLFVAPVAVGLAVLITWALKAVWMLGHNSTLPRLECRRRERVVWIVGVLNVLLLTIWGFLRFYAIVALFLPWLLGGLSIGLPLFAAGLFVVGDLFDERNALAREHEDVTTVIDHVVELLQKCENVAQDIDVSPGQSPRNSKSSTLRVAPVLNVLLLAMVGFNAFAGDSIGTAPCPYDRLNLWIDVSGSAEPTQLMETQALIRKTVEAATCVRTLAIYPFASALDAVRGPAERLDVPRFAFECPPCTGETCHIKPVLDKYVRECKRQEAVARTGYEGEWAAFDAKLDRVFRTFDNERPSPQTCLGQVITRTLREKPTVASVVVTDGVQYACGDEHPASGENSHVSVLLVSSKKDGPDVFESLERRETKIRQFDPKIDVIQKYRLDDRALTLQ